MGNPLPQAVDAIGVSCLLAENNNESVTSKKNPEIQGHEFDQAIDLSSEWTWNRITASANRAGQPTVGAEGEDDTAYHARCAARGQWAVRSQGRAKAITHLLHHRHGGPCDTDDAMTWLRAALPFVVDAAELMGRSAYAEGLLWAKRNCLAYVEKNGLQSVAAIITEALQYRDEAEEDRQETGRTWVYWLPDMPMLVAGLRPTFAEVTGLGLRGWASIDRPADEDLRARATSLRRDRRRASGVQAQAERTKTRDKAALASECGVSRKTIERWMAAGTLDANVARRRDVAKVSNRYIPQYGSDRFATSADNDDEQDHQAAA